MPGCRSRRRTPAEPVAVDLVGRHAERPAGEAAWIVGHRPPAMARIMHRGRGEVSHEMRRFLLMMIGVLGLPLGSPAACRWPGRSSSATSDRPGS